MSQTDVTKAEIVKRLVQWRLQGKGPQDDIDGSMFQLVNEATPDILFEAMRQYVKARASQEN